MSHTQNTRRFRLTQVFEAPFPVIAPRFFGSAKTADAAYLALPDDVISYVQVCDMEHPNWNDPRSTSERAVQALAS